MLVSRTKQTKNDDRSGVSIEAKAYAVSAVGRRSLASYLESTSSAESADRKLPESPRVDELTTERPSAEESLGVEVLRGFRLCEGDAGIGRPENGTPLE